MSSVLFCRVLTTTASPRGWGWGYGQRRGAWSSKRSTCHSGASSHLCWTGLCWAIFTMVVAYINRRWGTQSLSLLTLVLRSSAQILSVRVTHVPGCLNSGADLLSRVALSLRSGGHTPSWSPRWEMFGMAKSRVTRKHSLSSVSLDEGPECSVGNGCTDCNGFHV